MVGDIISKFTRVSCKRQAAEFNPKDKTATKTVKLKQSKETGFEGKVQKLTQEPVAWSVFSGMAYTVRTRTQNEQILLQYTSPSRHRETTK